MEISVRSVPHYAPRMDARTEGPAVVAANWYRFRAGERIRHERVLSLCFLWVLAGTGTVRSCGDRFALTSGSVLRLPWDHDVEYLADDRAPFRLGTVHVVPRHDRSSPVLPAVAHQPGDPLYDAVDRRGDPGRPRRSAATTSTARRIASLGGYTVERFVDGPFDEGVSRALGALFVAEDGLDAAGDAAVPAALELMTAHVRRNLDRPLPVAEIAAAGGCSVSTAGRLFAAHLGTSASAWVRSVRMREAAEMLRSSGLRVGEVARAVGFEDQLYFSRVFRATFGTPPSRYGVEQIRP